MDKSGVSATRNLVRPFFNQRKVKSHWKQLQAVRGLVTEGNAAQILAVTEGKAHFPFPGLGNTFPSSPDRLPYGGFRRLTALPERRELRLQIARLNHHAERVAAALVSLANINDQLATGDWSETHQGLLEAHEKAFGWSLVYTRKSLLALVMSEGLTGLNRSVRNSVESYPNRLWSVYCHHVYDLVDPTFDPSSAVRHWIKITRPKQESDLWFTGVFDDSTIGTLGPDDRANSLLRMSTASLLDTALFVWKHGSMDGPLSYAIPSLDARITSVLTKRFSRLVITPSAIYASPEGSVPDAEVFRMSLLFSDVSEIALWRASLSKLVLPRGVTQHVANKWFDDLSSEIAREDFRASDVATVVADQKSWQTAWLSDDVVLANQNLLHSAVLAQALRAGELETHSERSEIAESIAAISDVHEYVDDESLRTFISHEESPSDLLDVIVRDVLFRKFRSRDNDLERRLAIMQLVTSSGGKSLPAFIRDISVTAPKAAQQIARFCSRLFLEKLFLLVSSLPEVLQARIEICGWLIERDVKDKDALEAEVASLREEFANLDIRSELDSTRIHVDEDSMRDWFVETQKSAVVRYIQTVVAEGPARSSETLLTFLTTKERGPSEDDVSIESQVGSEYLLVSIFATTLRAFVSDKSFGLDAYLSRRIRHGTLSGYVMTPLVRVTKKIEESDAVSQIVTDDGTERLVDLANGWRKRVAAELDDARKHVIQLYGESQPRGLIRADWRTAGSIRHIDAAAARIRARVLETKGAYDIFGDLYALCWACVEPDLAQLRRYLLRDLFPRATAELQELWARLDGRSQLIAHSAVSELQGALRNKVHEVCGWFIRPVFRQDSYSLKMLILSTLSIAKELDDSYSFIEEVNVDESITLNRASFDVFADLLFVVVGNAAKYGAPGGAIQISASVEDAEDSSERVIGVEVQSFVEDYDKHTVAVERIRSAMQSQDKAIEEAAVAEGFSGLRKAVGIIKHIRSDNAAMAFFADSPSLSIKFALYLPAEIAASRSN